MKALIRTILTILTSATVLPGLAVFAPPALAATANCGDYAAMAQVLADTYGETPLFSGLSVQGQKVVLATNPDGSTWTILVIGAGGTACIAAVGTEWQPGSPAAPGVEG